MNPTPCHGTHGTNAEFSLPSSQRKLGSRALPVRPKALGSSFRWNDGEVSSSFNRSVPLSLLAPVHDA